MPHCGKPLYNNLLWANWTPERLSKLVLIGNRFDQLLTVDEHLPEIKYIIRAIKIAEITPLPYFERCVALCVRVCVYIHTTDVKPPLMIRV
jgi:hypothetical protein